MLGFFSLLIAAGVAYAFIAEGMFTAFVMCCNVFIAGLIAFNFWEPLAGQLDQLGLMGYEDIVSMMLLFMISLGALRTVTNILADSQIEFEITLQRIGGALFGFIGGYLVAGFFVCAIQTLPWDENFMGFHPEYSPDQHVLRHFLPPDRVWLGLMQRAGNVAFTDNDDQSFDDGGTFEYRYARYRRYTNYREPQVYRGEFDRELNRIKPRPETPP